MKALIPEIQVTKLIWSVLCKKNTFRGIAFKHGVYYTCSTTREDAPETCNRVHPAPLPYRVVSADSWSQEPSQNPLGLDRTKTMEIHFLLIFQNMEHLAQVETAKWVLESLAKLVEWRSNGTESFWGDRADQESWPARIHFAFLKGRKNSTQKICIVNMHFWATRIFKMHLFNMHFWPIYS